MGRETAAMRVSHIERGNPLIIHMSYVPIGSASQFPGESSFSAQKLKATIHGWYAMICNDFKRSFQDQRSGASNHNQRGQDVSQALLDRNKLLRAKVDLVDFHLDFSEAYQKKSMLMKESYNIYNPGLGGNSLWNVFFWVLKRL